jgi:hypothetical protein
MRNKSSVSSAPVWKRLSSLREPIRIGLIGMGAMGKGLLHQISITPGIECVAMADIVPQKAIDCAEMQGLPYKLARTAGEVQDAIRCGFVAICEDGHLAEVVPRAFWWRPPAPSGKRDSMHSQPSRPASTS